MPCHFNNDKVISNVLFRFAAYLQLFLNAFARHACCLCLFNQRATLRETRYSSARKCEIILDRYNTHADGLAAFVTCVFNGREVSSLKPTFYWALASFLANTSRYCLYCNLLVRTQVCRPGLLPFCDLRHLTFV